MKKTIGIEPDKIFRSLTKTQLLFRFKNNMGASAVSLFNNNRWEVIKIKWKNKEDFDTIQKSEVSRLSGIEAEDLVKQWRDNENT